MWPFGPRRSYRGRYGGGLGRSSRRLAGQASHPIVIPSSGWRRFLPPLIVIGILAVAPALALAQTVDSVLVRWSAPGDDGSAGTATNYDLRVSESPITAGNFNQALQVPGMPAPLPSGTSQRVTVLGLTRGRTYYFAIRTVDNNGNWSVLSNVVQFDWGIDTSPPAAPNGLQAITETDGIHLSWAANAEPDLAGYNVYRRVGGGGAMKLNSGLLTQPHYVDGSAPAGGQSIVYEVSAVDVHGNESAHTPTTSIDALMADAWTLKPGYPNPSRLGQAVRIPVVIPAGAKGNASVQILDASGQVVRRIVLSNPSPGSTEVVWDGLNDAGRVTAPGVYRGWLMAGDSRSSVRLLRVP